ncbi:MAG: nitroreductase family protein [Actinomycetota bacterium]|nr:nitroreductase family protein [Actinomycetota bacterium]
MDFSEVVRRRRMVRNYRPEPPGMEAIERIVAIARRVPSAGFSQGQYLVVVTEAQTRRAIAELAGEADYVASGFDPWMSGAPVHVVVCTSEADYHSRYREPDKLRDDATEIEWPVPYWYVDAGATMMLLLLTAVDEGLAAGFFGVHRLAGLGELLGIPSHVTPIGVVTLGYPAPDRRSHSLRRGWKPLEQVVHWQRWEGPAAQAQPSSTE